MTVRKPKSRPRNRRGEGSLLGQQIVAAALAAVNAGTPPETIALRSLARDVGIATTSIYAHFATVEDIIKAAAEEGFAALAVALARAVAGVRDPRQRLDALVQAYVRFATRQPALYRLLFATSFKKTAGGRSKFDATRGGEAFAALREAMQACIDAGISEHRDATTAATMVWVALHGYVSLTTTHSDFPWRDKRRLLQALVARVAELKSAR